MNDFSYFLKLSLIDWDSNINTLYITNGRYTKHRGLAWFHRLYGREWLSDIQTITVEDKNLLYRLKDYYGDKKYYSELTEGQQFAMLLML